MISRRALFGLTIGAAAASVSKPAQAAPVIVGMDFGKNTALAFATVGGYRIEPPLTMGEWLEHIRVQRAIPRPPADAFSPHL